jgi:hypothetical protein
MSAIGKNLARPPPRDGDDTPRRGLLYRVNPEHFRNLGARVVAVLVRIPRRLIGVVARWLTLRRWAKCPNSRPKRIAIYNPAFSFLMESSSSNSTGEGRL